MFSGFYNQIFRFLNDFVAFFVAKMIFVMFLMMSWPKSFTISFFCESFAVTFFSNPFWLLDTFLIFRYKARMFYDLIDFSVCCLVFIPLKFFVATSKVFSSVFAEASFGLAIFFHLQL